MAEITVQPLVIIVGAVSVLGLGLGVSVDGIRSAFRRRKERLRVELRELLPEPWLAAYHECQLADGTRLLWLKTWLAKEIRYRKERSRRNLPSLSVLASRRFCEMVTGSSFGPDFSAAMQVLSPHWKFDLREDHPDA